MPQTPSVHGFIEFTNDTKQITPAEGWTQITINNDPESTGNVTITGVTNRTIGGQICGAITLKPSQSYTFGNAKTVIGNITVVAASGATCKIGGYVQPEII